MADYIVTEVVTYRVTDMPDEDAAIQHVIDSADRDKMFEDCLDRTAERVDEPT